MVQGCLVEKQVTIRCQIGGRSRQQLRDMIGGAVNYLRALRSWFFVIPLYDTLRWEVSKLVMMT